MIPTPLIKPRDNVRGERPRRANASGPLHHAVIRLIVSTSSVALQFERIDINAAVVASNHGAWLHMTRCQHPRSAAYNPPRLKSFDACQLRRQPSSPLPYDLRTRGRIP